ncbi:hypothetical protein WG947_02150 [Pontibacter sp. H259]|uniref:hypothetical protein n=1 Tax=Pontibacter sp. H259 TaxID=3133421 RepID=UPI0030C3F7F5
MKKLKFLSYLMAALLLVTSVSCDDDDDDDASPNNTSLLTASTWKGDKLYYQGVDVTEDFSPILDVKATTIKFNANGTYTITADGTSDTGTWEFTNNETQVLMDEGTDDELLIDVNRLTATELWAEGDFAGSGGTETFELRFVH